MELTATPLHAAALPRLSRRAGFWAIALSFLAVTSFSTAPSALYGIYERQLHLSSLTITFVYAVYAVGVTVSLLLAGHVSDWYGRRAVLLPSLALAMVAALIFIAGKSLPTLLLARVLTGITLGAVENDVTARKERATAQKPPFRESRGRAATCTGEVASSMAGGCYFSTTTRNGLSWSTM